MIGLHSKNTGLGVSIASVSCRSDLLQYLLDFCVCRRNSRMLEAHKRRGASAIEKPVIAGCTLLTLEHPSLLSKSLYLARYLSPQFTQPIRTCSKRRRHFNGDLTHHVRVSVWSDRLMLTMKGDVLFSPGDTTSPLWSFLEANVCSTLVTPPPVGLCSPELVASCISVVSHTDLQVVKPTLTLSHTPTDRLMTCVWLWRNSPALVCTRGISLLFANTQVTKID